MHFEEIVNCGNTFDSMARIGQNSVFKSILFFNIAEI